MHNLFSDKQHSCVLGTDQEIAYSTIVHSYIIIMHLQQNAYLKLYKCPLGGMNILALEHDTTNNEAVNML